MRWIVAGALLASTTGCFLLSSQEPSCEEDRDCSGSDTCRDGACVAVCLPLSRDEACAGVVDARQVDDGCGTGSYTCACVAESQEELCGAATGLVLDRCGDSRPCPCIDDCADLPEGSTNSCGDRCVPDEGGWVLLPTVGAEVPGPRAYPGVALHPDEGYGLVHGGEAADRLAANVVGTWRFELESVAGSPSIRWTPLCPDGGPSVTAHVLVWHPLLARFVLLGGWTGGDGPVTWEASVWTSTGNGCFEQFAGSGVDAASGPGLRRDVFAAVDPTSGALLLLGGHHPGGSVGGAPGEPWRLWSWDGAAWSSAAIELQPTPGAAERYDGVAAGGAAFDPRHGMVFFGGEPIGADEVYSLSSTVIVPTDGVQARWLPPTTDASGEPEPPPRTRLAMAFAAGPGVVVRATGKLSIGGYARDTWYLDAAARWRRLEGLAPEAPPTTGGRLVDVPGWGLVLFGGSRKGTGATATDGYTSDAYLLSNRTLRRTLGLSREP